MKKRKILIGSTIGFLLIGLAAFSSLATSTLFGEATIVAGGNPGMAVQAVSDLEPGFGGVSFDDANGTFINGLTNLAADFNVTDDNCGAGSPRFSIRVDSDNDNALSAGDKRVLVYLGTHPNFNTCTPTTWVSSGNLTTNPDPRWDTSQLVGGTFYDTFANAGSLTATNEILSISLVIDSGWNSVASGGDGEQTVLFDNVAINNALYDFEPSPTPSPSLSPTPGPFAAPSQCSETYGAPIIGTSKSEKINGTSGNDLIFALGGSDSVDGKGGNDCIVGGSGSDSLKGGEGNDVILGGDGSDSIKGDGGDDDLYGENGSDSVKGGSGNDDLFGGNNSDSLKGDGGTDTSDGGNGSDACNAETESTCEA